MSKGNGQARYFYYAISRGICPWCKSKLIKGHSSVWVCSRKKDKVCTFKTDNEKAGTKLSLWRRLFG